MPALTRLPRFLHGTAESERALAQLGDRGEADFSKAEPVVRAILDELKQAPVAERDAVVLRHVARLEKRTPRALVVRGAELAALGEAALGRLPADARAALAVAAARIERFHVEERTAMFPGMGVASRSATQGPATSHGGFQFEEGGRRLGLRARPLARVGVYAPGGKARYPSSVLMSAIPARVAGVEEIVVATPLSPSGTERADDVVLAAAHLSGATALVDAGGAQAIGMLAYGTSSMPRVDKIVGPGNAFVACAKRLVYGAVSIDSIAGPSEILVVADHTADPAIVAADLLSQAEHDEDAYPLLVCLTVELVDAVERELERQLSDLPRAAIASASLSRHGAAFVVENREALRGVANLLAAEHVALHVEDADGFAEGVRNAGALFLGALTPEAAGDYVAGPSHVLPTGGVVRFGSPLGIHDFVARSSLIRYTADALRGDEATIGILARLEGLEAHARAVTIRTRSAARAGADGAPPGAPVTDLTP